MAPPQHGEIVKQLGDGWAIRWDSTHVDPETQAAVRRVAKARSDELRAILADSVREAGFELPTAA
ncbi:MAG TPA: hypothetical protein VLK58_22390 [Conexibacter sp.]|nr:hypothetical protein [Conexibacter sp.]